MSGERVGLVNQMCFLKISAYITLELKKGKQQPLLKLGCSNLPQTLPFKYLGVYFDSWLVWKDHIIVSNLDLLLELWRKASHLNLERTRRCQLKILRMIANKCLSGTCPNDVFIIIWEFLTLWKR